MDYDHYVANENAKENFTIPVSWCEYGTVQVQAASLEEAYNWANEHIDELACPTESYYLDESYEIAADSVEECEPYN